MSASASKSDVRHAYLKLARRYHPDFHQNELVDSDSSVAFKIRQVNAAWEILGDDDRRHDYDLFLLETPARSVAADADPSQFRVSRSGPPTVSRIRRPSSQFTPHDGEEDLSEAWRYQPDEVNPATVPSRLLLAAPAVFFVLGLAMLALSVPTAIRAFTAAGLISLFASAMLFIGVPVIAMFKSRNEELRSAKRRSTTTRR